MGRRERSRGGEGVKKERGKGSQEEGWKNNQITESPVRHLFQGWVEVTPGDRSPADQLPNLTEDRGGVGQKVRATFLVRLLAGAVTGQVLHDKNAARGLGAYIKTYVTRMRTECKVHE